MPLTAPKLPLIAPEYAPETEPGACAASVSPSTLGAISRGAVKGSQRPSDQRGGPSLDFFLRNFASELFCRGARRSLIPSAIVEPFPGICCGGQTPPEIHDDRRPRISLLDLPVSYRRGLPKALPAASSPRVKTRSPSHPAPRHSMDHIPLSVPTAYSLRRFNGRAANVE